MVVERGRPRPVGTQGREGFGQRYRFGFAAESLIELLDGPGVDVSGQGEGQIGNVEVWVGKVSYRFSGEGETGKIIPPWAIP